MDIKLILKSLVYLFFIIPILIAALIFIASLLPQQKLEIVTEKYFGYGWRKLGYKGKFNYRIIRVVCFLGGIFGIIVGSIALFIFRASSFWAESFLIYITLTRCAHYSNVCLTWLSFLPSSNTLRNCKRVKAAILAMSLVANPSKSFA